MVSLLRRCRTNQVTCLTVGTSSDSAAAVFQACCVATLTNMGKSSRGKRDVVAGRLAKQQQRLQAFDDSPVQDAHRILAELEKRPASYRLSFYAVEPEELGGDLNVPVDEQVHAHPTVLGKTLSLREDARRDDVTAASRAFTGPFIAVIRRPEAAESPVTQATIVQGVSLASEMVRGPLEILMRARVQERLHFGGFLGMSTSPGEWMASGPDEMRQITTDFQLRVEAEAVIAAGEYMASLHS